MTQAARFRKLVMYVDEPNCFLKCCTYRIALPLSRIPQHFGNSKNHNYERQDCIEVLEAWKAVYRRFGMPIRSNPLHEGIAEEGSGEKALARGPWMVSRTEKGRPSIIAQKNIQRRLEQGCKTVYCQRFFVQGQGSEYFEV
jgi:hypothetical protein